MKTTLFDAIDTSGAFFHEPDFDNLRITPRTERSGTTNDCLSLDSWLLQRKYDHEAPRGVHEFARLRRGDKLIILYNSGSVVAAGDDWAAAWRELQPLVKAGRV